MRQNTTRRGQDRGQDLDAERRAEEKLWATDSAALDAQRFEETGNPTHAWSAVAACLGSDVPLPDSVRAYLAAVAGEVLSLSSGRVPKKGQIARAAAGALKLRGSSRFNPFATQGEWAHEIGVAFSVYHHHSRNRLKQRAGLEGTKDWNSIFREVVEAHRTSCRRCAKPISVATVKRYWYKHAKTVIPRHLVERSESQIVDDILR